MYFKRWLLFELVASALVRPAECQGSLLPWKQTPPSACKMAQAAKFAPGSREAIFSLILPPPPTHTQSSLWGLGLQVQCCLVLWLQRQGLEITCGKKNRKQHMKQNKTWPLNTQSVSQRVKDSALNQPACTDNFLFISSGYRNNHISLPAEWTLSRARLRVSMKLGLLPSGWH